MKIALICPTNIEFMPYFNNYYEILAAQNIELIVFCWNRLNLAERDTFIYFKDNKTSMQRGFLDYRKYVNFIIRELSRREVDRIVIFGIQLTFFMDKFLIENYKRKYIIDIRDFNKVYRFKSFKPAFRNSFINVVSSKGFLKWLPKDVEYVVNHNISNLELNRFASLELNNQSRPIKLSYIGTIRDFKINLKLIDKLKNNIHFDLYYHGYSVESNELKKYVDKEFISNVFFTGKYNQNSELELYENSDLINILIPNDDINSQTLLPNRLYRALITGKPILTIKGTYIADIIEDFGLGIIINDFSELDQLNYLYDSTDFKKLRIQQLKYIEKVKEENLWFMNTIINFSKETLLTQDLKQ